MSVKNYTRFFFSILTLFWLFALICLGVLLFYSEILEVAIPRNTENRTEEIRENKRDVRNETIG